jgi:rhodanese-related sulfurtransferase
MQVGDSVLIETRHKATNIANHLRNLGYKPVTRAVDGGVRVWKMEKKNADE